MNDGETLKQRLRGRRAAKKSDQNEAKGFRIRSMEFRNLLTFRNDDKTEREMDVKAAEWRIIARTDTHVSYTAIHALIGDK